MSGSPRGVFDTNVLVSSLLTSNSPPQQALDIILDRGTLIFSQVLLTELVYVLAREKFGRYLSQVRRARLTATLSKMAGYGRQFGSDGRCFQECALFL